VLTRSTTTVLSFLLGCSLLGLTAGALDESTSIARAATPQRSIGVIRLCSGCAGVGDHSRYQYVLLNAGDYGRIPALRAASPGIKLLVYKDMSSTRSWDCGGSSAAGVDYCWADRSRPDWFTHRDGSRIEWSGYRGAWQMNVGLKEYQDQWAANVLGELRSKGWDGVVVDNANIDPSGFAPLPYDEYPTQESYQAATRSFLANVGPTIRSEGFLVLPNIQHHGSLLTEALWRDWTRFTSGGHLEHYTKWGSGTGGHIGGAGWELSGQAFVRASQAAGKIFLGTFSSPTSDVRSMRYARASFLLDWDGGPSALAFDPNPLSADPWSSEWTIDVGLPLAARYAVGQAWRRDFTGGVVLANPSGSTETVALGGLYRLPGGTVVSTISLPATSGAILTPASPPSATEPSSSSR
jgi:Hypothetical glycosyl hydrolase family 15